MKRPLLVALVAAIAICAGMARGSEEARKIWWEELIPEGWTPPPMSIDHYFDATPAQELSAAEAPVVEALNGQRVTLPGYVVPLDVEGGTLRRFLMVPYFGACIHVPPPPPNQIVFVEMKQPVRVNDPYGAYWVTGVLATRQQDTDLAETSYSMTGESVEVFDFEAYFADYDDADEASGGR